MLRLALNSNVNFVEFFSICHVHMPLDTAFCLQPQMFLKLYRTFEFIPINYIGFGKLKNQTYNKTLQIHSSKRICKVFCFILLSHYDLINFLKNTVSFFAALCICKLFLQIFQFFRLCRFLRSCAR